MGRSTAGPRGDGPPTDPDVDRPPEPALGELLAPVRRRLVVACALQAAGAAAGVIPFVAVAEIVRELLGDIPPDDGRLWFLGRVAVGAFAVRGVLQMAAGTLSHHADNDLQLSIRRRLAAHLRRVPLGWFDEHGTGTVKTAVGDDVGSLHHLVGHALLDLSGAVVAPLVSIAYLFAVDWRLALVALGPVVTGVAIYAWQMVVSARTMATFAEALAAVSSTAIEFVRGIAVVKTFGEARRADTRFTAATSRFVDMFWNRMRGIVRSSAANEVLMSPLASLALILGAGTLFAANGWSTPASVGAVVVLGVNLTAPVLSLGHSVHHLQQATHAAGRIGALLHTAELPTVEADDRRITTPDAHVEIDAVSFGYGDGAEVLRDVSLSLTPGTVTALVGRSGSGKSTIAKLVARFWDVNSGAIRIGGVDIRDVPLAELYRHVGFVFQDGCLLSTSLRDNIALAVPEATDEQVHAAAAAARIHDRIMRMPRGYDAVPGQDVLLSGGEQQRVSIARALIADSPILVFDEATASVDPDTEATIQDALSTLAAGKTVLVVAHRLPTVIDVDQIAVVDAGRIVEVGRHTELLAAGGLYTKLWASHQRLVEDAGSSS